MPRILRVALDGFKGLQRAYTLLPGTVLSGPNGSGKTACLEAIVYALSGRVPAGRSLDAVALYFLPNGGAVTLYDEDGHWIRRGIQKAGSKISGVLETSDGTDLSGKNPDTHRWQASDVVLDLSELFALSADKRREFVLRLCGSTESGAEVLTAVEHRYAKAVLGAAASAKTLHAPPLTDDGLVDLPRESEELRDSWVRDGGMRDMLSSVPSDAIGVSEFCLKLGDLARAEMLSARRSATEAKSAVQDLEAALGGHAASELSIEAARDRLEEAEKDLSEARFARQSLARAHAEHEKAERAYLDCQETLRSARTELMACEDPGPEPKAPTVAQDRDLGDRFAELRTRIDAATVRISELRGLISQYDRIAEDILITDGEISVHEDDEIAEATRAVEKIPDAVHPAMPDLRRAVALIAEGWRSRLESLTSRRQALSSRAAVLLADVSAAGPEIERLTAQLKADESQAEQIKMELYAEAERRRDSESAHRAAISAWRRITQLRSSAAKAITATEEREKTLLIEVQNRRRMLEAVDDAPSEDDILALERTLDEAQEAAFRCERAAGAANAHAAAVERARKQSVAAEAWKHAEAAIKAAREQLVGSAMAGILDTANEVLERTGREDRVYLRTENARGKPIFEIGLTKAGVEREIQSLSGGETAILSLALSISIALLSKGRRALLCEADPLDSQNFGALLTAATPWLDRLDVAVVATSRGAEPPPGWHVIQLGAGAAESKAAIEEGVA